MVIKLEEAQKTLTQNSSETNKEEIPREKYISPKHVKNSLMI